jgi:hypothetical protein
LLCEKSTKGLCLFGISSIIALWQARYPFKSHISELPDIVSKNIAYQNAMKNSDAKNARDESDCA